MKSISIVVLHRCLSSSLFNLPTMFVAFAITIIIKFSLTTMYTKLRQTNVMKHKQLRAKLSNLGIFLYHSYSSLSIYKTNLQDLDTRFEIGTSLRAVCPLLRLQLHWYWSYLHSFYSVFALVLLIPSLKIS